MTKQHDVLYQLSLRVMARATLLLVLGAPTPVRAHIECTPGDDLVCVTKLREGSVCTEQGTCSNPLRHGCLRKLLPEYADVLRTCNSDDDLSDPTVQCRPSELNYPEIRILNQNWDTAMLSAWIMQSKL